MKTKRFDIWLTDLPDSYGTEPGKTRPAVIVQTNRLNQAEHLSTIICPVSSQHREGFTLLRIEVKASSKNGLQKTSYILTDQIRAISVSRLRNKIGELDFEDGKLLADTLSIILDLNKS